MWFDTHAHFDGAGDAMAAGLLDRAAAAGVTRVVAIGHHPGANADALRVAGMHPGAVRAAVGLDRDCAGAAPDLASLEEMIRTHPAQVVAVGEIGLDYHHAADSRLMQIDLLERELELARRWRLPVVLHSRDADDDMLTLCRTHAAAWSGAADRIGILHCFTEDEAFARSLLDLGFMISFSGIVTFRNADPLRAVARIVPSERLLVETDTPYLAPVPHRGRPNEPALLPAVGACLAQVRGIPVEELAAVTYANALRVFGWI